ncbi:NAD(P)/FAD-dependent oxidoreductase [Hydrogenophilus thiooxidans]|uniref:NAD(P)/FAD-dependent oxidoreductase n=1 Tax=Hydrogenophilus thiooxidans TaxID=2820326 RepID=UPI001C215C5C|nr:NAD(P)/FAD-dependent oxidoreductase [Hydrogenophilus thiooxidans]
MSDSLSVAVIGAGPAGLSAALWLKQLGYTPFVLEAADAPGGILRFNFLANEWVLGHHGLTGVAMSERFVAHAEALAIAIECGRTVHRLVPIPQGWRLFLADDTPRHAAAVIVATGLRYRGPEAVATVAGMGELTEGEVAYGPFAFRDLEQCQGKTVLIVGGGDNAFENAKMIAELGGHALILCRSQPRAQRQLREAAARFADRVRVVAQAALRAVCREAGKLVAHWQTVSDKTEAATVDRLHFLIGYAPNSEWLVAALGDAATALARDAAGYLITDRWGRTPLLRLYAAGDLVERDFPNVVSALASGARAAKAVDIDLGAR